MPKEMLIIPPYAGFFPPQNNDIPRNEKSQANKKLFVFNSLRKNADLPQSFPHFAAGFPIIYMMQIFFGAA
jgi:hypothetical protein